MVFTASDIRGFSDFPLGLAFIEAWSRMLLLWLERCSESLLLGHLRNDFLLDSCIFIPFNVLGVFGLSPSTCLTPSRCFFLV